MRTTVNIEDHRILLALLKIRRALHPGLDALAVEALVPDHDRLGEIELREQLVIDLGEPAHLPRRDIQQEQVADVGRRRNQHRGLRCIRRRAVREHIVIALGERLHLPGFRVDSLQIRPPFLRRDHVDESAVLAPERLRWPTAARRRLIAADAARDVVIVIRGEILRRRTRLERRDEQIRLAVGSLHAVLADLDRAPTNAMRVPSGLSAICRIAPSRPATSRTRRRLPSPRTNRYAASRSTAPPRGAT